MTNVTMLPPEHIGDGVYVSDEGYAIALRVNDHRGNPVVLLEPDVLDALVRYAERCKSSRISDIPTILI